LKSRRLVEVTCEVNHVHRRPLPRGVRDADPVSDPTARRRVQVEGHGKNPGGIERLTSPTELLASTGRCAMAEMFAALAPNGAETGTAQHKSARAMPPVVGAWRESSGVQRRSTVETRTPFSAPALPLSCGTSTPAILWLREERADARFMSVPPLPSLTI
jgi:hypothetical protein